MSDTEFYEIGQNLAKYIKYNIAWDRLQLLNLVVAKYAFDVVAEPYETTEEDVSKINELINKLIK